jgi:2-(1,2-epoxy-1,2-dihydrophenyl)acetyl-CoA isomerase
VAGGGVSLVAAADVVVAAKSARFTSAFTKIGFSPDSGSTITLTRRMGAVRAKRFFLLGETLAAAEAAEAGLIDIVAEDEAVLSNALQIARSLADGPTRAYAGIKRLFLRAPLNSPETQMEDEAQTLAAIAHSGDALEGVTAFMQKRKPNFHGS